MTAGSPSPAHATSDFRESVELAVGLLERREYWDAEQVLRAALAVPAAREPADDGLVVPVANTTHSAGLSGAHVGAPPAREPEPLTPDERHAAAVACALYADEFCSDDQDEADRSGGFGPNERALLESASRKLAVSASERLPTAARVEGSRTEPPTEIATLVRDWREARSAVEGTVTPDPDYSPSFQDEYQRLWHEAAAERDQLKMLCRPVVERYGAHWLRDELYYAAAEALGLEPAPAVGAAEDEPIVPTAETHSSEAAPWGVECPCCYRRVVTTEAPCECGFRFPRGYGKETS